MHNTSILSADVKTKITKVEIIIFGGVGPECDNMQSVL